MYPNLFVKMCIYVTCTRLKWVCFHNMHMMHIIQGDQIGQFFTYWVIVYFGECFGKLHFFHGKNKR
jgi:hypothetical protein